MRKKQKVGSASKQTGREIAHVPAGLLEATLAEELSLKVCLKKFDLNWEEAKTVILQARNERWARRQVVVQPQPAPQPQAAPLEQVR